MEKVFQEGEKVLVLLPIPGESLRAKICGLYATDTVTDDTHDECVNPGDDFVIDSFAVASG